MHRLRAYLDEVLPASARTDAELILSRILPLAFEVMHVSASPWPFCEAIDESGAIQFFPKDYQNWPLKLRSAEELEEVLRLGLLSGHFRSVGLAELTQLSDARRVLQLDLFLARRVSVAVFIPLGFRSSLEVGSPLVLASTSQGWCA